MNLACVDQAIRRLHDAGAAHSPGFLDESWRKQLLAETRGIGPRHALEQYLKATQRFANTQYEPAQLPLGLKTLVETFGAAARANKAPGRQGSATSLADWRPDEVVLQRYDPGDLVLLRGKGFQGATFYGLPRHMVDACTEDRLLLILRMYRPAAQ